MPVLWVSTDFATFGLVFDQVGWCTEAAPIARWCKGQHATELLDYWAGRGAEVEWILP